jgi:HAMP domain-containing protein
LNGSRDAARIKFQDGRKLMDEIERLELRIEELREAIERSRRLRFAGRASAVIGPALLAGFALGLVAYTPTRMIVALALAIGGVVLTGSSRSSTEELERSLKQAETERMAAIDALDLVQVGEGTR